MTTNINDLLNYNETNIYNLKLIIEKLNFNPNILKPVNISYNTKNRINFKDILIERSKISSNLINKVINKLNSKKYLYIKNYNILLHNFVINFLNVSIIIMIIIVLFFD